MYKRYVGTYDLTFLWSDDVYERAREFLKKDTSCCIDSYSCYTELCEIATAEVIADKEADRLSRLSMRKSALDALDDHIMSSEDLAHVFKCCASVVPKGQLRDKLFVSCKGCTTDDIMRVTNALLNRKITGFITKLCIDLKDLPVEAIYVHADAISGSVMEEVAVAVGDFPKLTRAVFSRKYGDGIKQACIVSQDAEISKKVHIMVAKIVKRICVRDWDSMFRSVFERRGFKWARYRDIFHNLSVEHRRIILDQPNAHGLCCRQCNKEFKTILDMIKHVKKCKALVFRSLDVPLSVYTRFSKSAVRV
jgi:hypothetical protein